MDLSFSFWVSIKFFFSPFFLSLSLWPFSSSSFSSPLSLSPPPWLRIRYFPGKKSFFFFFFNLVVLVGKKAEWLRNGRVENFFVIFVVFVKRMKRDISGMCNFCFSVVFFAQLTKGRFRVCYFGEIRFSCWKSGLWA